MRLYKYCNGGGIEILRSFAIKVTSPLELNDPFDCKPVPDIDTPESREALKSQIRANSPTAQSLERGAVPSWTPPGLTFDFMKQEWDQLLEQSVNDPEIVSNSMKNSLSEFAILCLTKERSNHLMWSHYADMYQGFVLEIETEGVFPIGTVGTLTSTLYEVNYSDDRPIFRFDKPSLGAFTTKGKVWNYEHEWRVIFLQRQLDSRMVDGREMFLRPLPPDCIKAVFLGSRMPQSLRNEVSLLLSAGPLSHVNIFELKLDLKSFALLEFPYEYK